jgi:hypothetical protein
MSAPTTLKECTIGRVKVHLLDTDQCVFGVGDDPSAEQLLANFLELPREIATRVFLLSQSEGSGAQKFAEYEQIAREYRRLNGGHLSLVKGGRA